MTSVHNTAELCHEVEADARMCSPGPRALIHACLEALCQIDEGALGAGSAVGRVGLSLRIRLVHALDSLNVVELEIAEEDIGVTALGMHDSLKSQFPEEGDFPLEASRYLENLLRGRFRKVITLDEQGLPLSAEWRWDERRYAPRAYAISDSQLRKAFDSRHPMRREAYRYVAFIDNTLPPPQIEILSPSLALFGRDSISKALPIHRRVDWLPDSEKDGAETDSDRVRRWRRGRGLADPIAWSARLAALGVTERDFSRLSRLVTSHPGESRALHQLTGFLGDLAAAYCHPAIDDLPPDSPSSPPDSSLDLGPALFPIRVLALSQLRGALWKKLKGDLAVRTMLRSTEESLARSLVHRIKVELAPALVTVFSQTFGDGFGASIVQAPANRFREFCLNETRSLSWMTGFLRKHPALLWTLSSMVSNWRDASIELLRRLISDRNLLTSQELIHETDRLQSIEAGAGDPHAGGRCVSILRFVSGKKLVYKPRPLDTLKLFANFLQWLREEGHSPDLPRLKFVARSSYGWVEFIDHRSCSNVDEVEFFFRRQGSHAAILYYLGGQDLIGDNIIARGASPFLIDLECLVSPAVPVSPDNLAGSSLAGRMLAESVVRTGLFPAYSVGDLDSPGPNLAGLSPSPVIDRQIERPYTEMPQPPIPVQSRLGSRHLPRLNGVTVTVGGYHSAVVSGFETTYRFIRDHKRVLLSRIEEDPLWQTARVRVLLRHTRIYSKIAAEARHPEVQADAASKDLLLDHLWNAYDSTEMPGRIIQSEIEQIWDGDIPSFYSVADSRHLWDSCGRLLVKDFFKEAGLDGLLRRLNDSSEIDLERQVRLIRQSFAVFEELEHEKGSLPGFSSRRKSTIDRGRCLKAAVSIADRILEAGFSCGNGLSWIDVGVSERGHWEQTIKPPGLYDGTDGIALFFAYLSLLSGERRFKSAARTLFEQSRRFLNQVSPEKNPLLTGRISPFVFPTSVAFVASHLACLWPGRIDLSGTEDRVLDWVEKQIQSDSRHDLIHGACGAIPFLLDISGSDRSSRAFSCAVNCGAHLLEKSETVAGGTAWQSPEFRHLGGFAHGTSSFSWALLLLASRSGEERFRSAGLSALAYDRGLFDEAAGVWRDKRHDRIRPFSAWCHGSAGVGLGRLLCQDLAETGGNIEQDLIAACRNLCEVGFGLSHCLCHGQMGNLEILYGIARHLDDDRTKERVHHHLGSMLESVEASDWRCGKVGAEIDLFGLMMGLSGIGYGLLRFANWEKVPSVLCLEGPTELHSSLH